MEIWSEREIQRPSEIPIEMNAQEKLQVLQHAYSERSRELAYLKSREDKLILWLASFFSLTILGSLIFNSSPVHWVAKLFLCAIIGLVAWYGSEYISQGRDDMQATISLVHDLREEILLVTFGYSRELLPDPNRWEVASRWEMGPIDMFLKGTALVAILSLLFA